MRLNRSAGRTIRCQFLISYKNDSLFRLDYNVGSRCEIVMEMTSIKGMPGSIEQIDKEGK